jgi:hypothetical protein
MLDSFSIDEKRNVGKILVLPNSPRYNLNEPPRPQWRPHSTPFPQRPQDIADCDQARELADQMLATMPDDLHAAAVAAYLASEQAAAALHAAEQEYAGLNDLMPPGLSDKQRNARLNRRARLESDITDLRAANAAAGNASMAALEAARRHVQLYSGCPVYDQEQCQIREMRAEAARLERAAGERQMALSKAITLVNVWLPVDSSTLSNPYQRPIVKHPNRAQQPAQRVEESS